jgi:hypothetical protein
VFARFSNKQTFYFFLTAASCVTHIIQRPTREIPKKEPLMRSRMPSSSLELLVLSSQKSSIEKVSRHIVLVGCDYKLLLSLVADKSSHSEFWVNGSDLKGYFSGVLRGDTKLLSPIAPISLFTFSLESSKNMSLIRQECQVR